MNRFPTIGAVGRYKTENDRTTFLLKYLIVNHVKGYMNFIAIIYVLLVFDFVMASASNRK